MKGFRVRFISVGICLLLQAVVASAGWFGADFSADLVKGTSQGQAVHGRMYVGAGRVRTEMKQQEQWMIEIIDPVKGVAWLLDQRRKVYQQRSVPKVAQANSQDSGPCAGITGAQCRRLPDELLNGRLARKWLIQLNGKERIQWNDAQHDFPVQVAEGGHLMMTMTFLAGERLAGRQVERWKARQYRGKEMVESEQWYDPQLNIAVRQLAQDGSFRELRNIKLGNQADTLFELPQGYSKTQSVLQ